MKFDSHSPLIGIPVCARELDGHPFHMVGEKYITGVGLGAGGLPMLIPALGDAFDPRDLVRRLDGLLVTGSPSNVAVDLYGGAPDRPDSPQDPKRDATTLPLIRAAVEDGLPLFCICRGIQELNVAFGGTLHTRVHEQPAAFDHRAPQGEMEEDMGRAMPWSSPPTARSRAWSAAGGSRSTACIGRPSTAWANASPSRAGRRTA